MALNGNVARFALPSGFTRFSPNAGTEPVSSAPTYTPPSREEDSNLGIDYASPPSSPASGSGSEGSISASAHAPAVKLSPLVILERIEAFEHSMEPTEGTHTHTPHSVRPLRNFPPFLSSACSRNRTAVGHSFNGQTKRAHFRGAA